MSFVVPGEQIRDVLAYLNGFRGFSCTVREPEGERRDLILRSALFYERNSVLVVEFHSYSLVIHDALNRAYSNPKPTLLRSIGRDGKDYEVEIDSLANSMWSFLDAFVPRDPNPAV